MRKTNYSDFDREKLFKENGYDVEIVWENKTKTSIS